MPRLTAQEVIEGIRASMASNMSHLPPRYHEWVEGYNGSIINYYKNKLFYAPSLIVDIDCRGKQTQTKEPIVCKSILITLYTDVKNRKRK